MKKILASLVTIVVLGTGGLAVASATAWPAASTPASTTRTKPATHPGTVRTMMRRLAFTTAASTIGMSPTDLLAAMKGGHSIADVAKTHSVEPQTVIDAIIRSVDARVQQALTNGTITSTQAAKLDHVVATRAPKFVDATPKQLIRRRILADAVNISAKTIGVTAQALRDAIVSGQSVAQVATAHGVNPTTVVSALVTAGDARIDRAVANHHLTAAHAAKLKARLPRLAQRFVDSARSPAKQQATAA